MPVIISDGANLPFTSVLNWDEFSVTIPERDLLVGADYAKAIFNDLIRDRDALRRRQHALHIARHDLIYGIGSPFNSTRAFNSRIADHVLEEALVMSKVDGRFRRFPEAFQECDTPAGGEGGGGAVEEKEKGKRGKGK